MLFQEQEFCLQELCQTLEISRSGFYGHLGKAQRPRRQQDEILTLEIQDAFEQSRHTYGTPRLRHDLLTRGHRCGRRRIARLMRQQGLRPWQKRRFVPRTTDSSHGRSPAPQRLLHAPAPSRPGQVWVTDITYIPTREGMLFLAAEIDLCSRKVLGWATAEHMETSLVLEAFHKAVTRSQTTPTGLVHHSDQGSQYASDAFQSALAQLGILQSMSRRGNCYDNATAESFWATLKTECFHHQLPATRAQARTMIFVRV
jgi:transposase InsO family protein